MFKCSTWLCIAKLVRDHETRPWIWEGFAENRKHPRCLCWFNSWVGTGYQKHPSPAAICDWFRELVSWVVDNWEKKKFPGALQWLDCLVWDKPGSAGTMGRGGLLASSLGSRRLGAVVLVASLLTVCRSWILELERSGWPSLSSYGTDEKTSPAWGKWRGLDSLNPCCLPGIMVAACPIIPVMLSEKLLLCTLKSHLLQCRIPS